MKRRSNSDGKSVKAGRRGTAARKRRPLPTAARKRRHLRTAVRRRTASVGRRERRDQRLARELDDITEQQRATSAVLRLIGGSSGDLQPVFASILASAVRLCDAHTGVINRWDGEALQLIATHNMPPAYVELRKRSPYRPDQHSASGRMLATRAPIHIADLAADKTYLGGNPPTVAAVELAGVRTALAVPMWTEGKLVGSFTVGRLEVRPFTDKQMEIVQDFAAQAVIAVENTRLLTELRQRTDELRRSVGALQRERSNRLMNLEAMAAAISHEVRQPLASIAANCSAALRFLAHDPPNIEEVRAGLNRTVNDSHRASQVFDNIRALFGKADQGRQAVDLNGLARGVLDGLRGEIEDRGIIVELASAPDLPPIIGHRGQLQEVLINLVRNAIEAMDLMTDGRRTLKVRTERSAADKVSVTIEDSGPGIDPSQIKGIFEPFVTTKARGMGLGLALCRMIVERHAGQLSASPAQPRGSIFRVVLPAGRNAATDATG